MGRILLKRSGALGDVILVTPIVERLQLSGHVVGIETKHSDVFSEWKGLGISVHSALRLDHLPWDKVFDLDGCYEQTPKIHVVDAYSMAVFGDHQTPHRPILPVKQIEEIWLRNNFLMMKMPYAVVHAARSWPNRTMKNDFWDRIAKKLPLPVLFVGGRQDYSGFGCATAAGLTTLGQVASIINRAKIFIGSDSALLHIAAAQEQTAVLGIFTCTSPSLRMPEGRIGGAPVASISASIDCAGCHHDLPPGTTGWNCHRTDLRCIDEVDPQDVLDIADGMLLDMGGY